MLMFVQCKFGPLISVSIPPSKDEPGIYQVLFRGMLWDASDFVRLLQILHLMGFQLWFPSSIMLSSSSCMSLFCLDACPELSLPMSAVQQLVQGICLCTIQEDCTCTNVSSLWQDCHPGHLRASTAHRRASCPHNQFSSSL